MKVRDVKKALEKADDNDDVVVFVAAHDYSYFDIETVTGPDVNVATGRRLVVIEVADEPDKEAGEDFEDHSSFEREAKHFGFEGERSDVNLESIQKEIEGM